MKFDFIIGNPPYQEEAKEGTIQAKPIYHQFVNASQELTKKSLIMITPARWFSGGMGLDTFRNQMLTCNQIRRIYEFANAKECFPANSISGGVCIFSWDRDYDGPCEFINILNGKENIETRYLNEYPILIRDNSAVDIIHKIMSSTSASFSDLVSAISPFALSTKIRGTNTREAESDLQLYSSAGVSYIPRQDVSKGIDLIDSYKVMLSQTGAEHAGEPSKDGMFRVLSSSMRVLKPGEVCTHSYIVLGNFDNYTPAENIMKFLKTRFVRFLVLQAVASIHISKATFIFVPSQDFTESSDIEWSRSVSAIDQQLYDKYGLDESEITFIESKIKEMV